MVQKRWTWFLKMKAEPEPSWERDIPFWTIPGTDRQLLCDLWRPADSKVSGLAFIYLHGSGWAALDKDVGTKSFFRHLVAQGHTVMDVAYRLIPEVDIHGMVADAKRAVAWIKAHAEKYGLNPEKIVLKKEQARNLRKAIMRLDFSSREIVMLKHFRDLSYDRIAEILKIPKGTVMSRLYYARRKLAEILGEYE